MLNCLGESGLKEFTNEHVNEAAVKVGDSLQGFLDRLWESFNNDSRKIFYGLTESEIENDRVGKPESRFLVAGGFAIEGGKKHTATCRLLADHVEGTKDGASAVGQLFGEWDCYRNNIRTILELRINQIPVANARLHRLVTKCLDDIPDHPDDCLNNLTSIEDVALDYVWESELGNGDIPNEIVAYWTQAPRDRDYIIKEMMAGNNWRKPRKRFSQIKILQRLTGSTEDFDRKAKYITKDSYVLLNAIHQFRNRTEHKGGQAIHEGVAVSALLLCIELLSCLAREIGGK